MVIGFTGTREGMTDVQLAAVSKLLLELNPHEVHHGDAMGADAQFHDLCCAVIPHAHIVIHPPLGSTKRAWKQGDIVLPERSYLQRNRDIVAASDTLIAAPKDQQEVLRSGTWSTVRAARKKCITVMTVWLNGNVSNE